jgi:hypothetical protein
MSLRSSESNVGPPGGEATAGVGPVCGTSLFVVFDAVDDGVLALIGP